MTAIHLARIDAEKNMARYYKLDVQPTLFGDWALIREYGRIGRGGTVRAQQHPTRGCAELALASAWVRKAKRGYRVVPCVR